MKQTFFRALSIAMLLVGACGRSGGPHRLLPTVQITGGPVESVISYTDVQPIFMQYCSRCHPSIFPPDWLDYDSALPLVMNGRLLDRVVVQKNMPLIGSPEALMITEDERQLIGDWARAGGPLTSPVPAE